MLETISGIELNPYFVLQQIKFVAFNIQNQGYQFGCELNYYSTGNVRALQVFIATQQ